MNEPRKQGRRVTVGLPKDTSEGEVYFLYCCNRVKIGWSRNNHLRRVTREIAPHIAVPAKLLGYVPASLHSESELHERFRRDRLDFEWFDLSPELRAFLCEDENRADLLEAAEDYYRDFIEDEYHRLFKGGPNDCPPDQPKRGALRSVPINGGSDGPCEVMLQNTAVGMPGRRS